MKLLRIFIPFVISLLIGLQSGSQDVIKNFKEINEKLERTNKMIDSILGESDLKIDSMTQGLRLVGFDPSVADSLTKLFDHTSKLITCLKNELKTADTSGEKLDIAGKLLIQTQTGDSLFNDMRQVYEAGVKYGDSTMYPLLKDIKKHGKDKWLERYFKMVPSVAAITILSKFRNDLVHVKFHLMNKGIQQLKNQILSEKN